MALISADKIVATVISWIEEQRPMYDTIIDRYYTGRRLSVFNGRRQSIGKSSLPAIEVSSSSDSLGWHACRVQGVEPSLQIDITTDNMDPVSAPKIQSILCTLTTRILASPVHLRPQILQTNTHIYDSLPTDVRYDQTAQNGAQRVATITWKAKYLEFIEQRILQTELQMMRPKVDFPTN